MFIKESPDSSIDTVDTVDTAGTVNMLNKKLNRISRIFHDYQHWALTLSDMLARSPSLQELAAVGESFFGNPVLVLDRNFCLLSKYDPSLQIAWSFHEQTQERMLPAAFCLCKKNSSDSTKAQCKSDRQTQRPSP